MADLVILSCTNPDNTFTPKIQQSTIFIKKISRHYARYFVTVLEYTGICSVKESYIYKVINFQNVLFNDIPTLYD